MQGSSARPGERTPWVSAVLLGGRLREEAGLMARAKTRPFGRLLVDRFTQDCKWSGYLAQFGRAIWRTNSASAGPHVGSAVVSPATTSRWAIAIPNNSTNLQAAARTHVGKPDDGSPPRGRHPQRRSTAAGNEQSGLHLMVPCSRTRTSVLANSDIDTSPRWRWSTWTRPPAEHGCPTGGQRRCSSSSPPSCQAGRRPAIRCRVLGSGWWGQTPLELWCQAAAVCWRCDQAVAWS